MANKAIVGEKVGMTQVWDEDNRVLPVTVLRVRPNRVVQVKTTERDGYTALQVTVGRRTRRSSPVPRPVILPPVASMPGNGSSSCASTTSTATRWARRSPWSRWPTKVGST